MTHHESSFVTAHPHAERLHALDAFRASMMLLGIVFHVAWFFLPQWAGHPITDRAASWGQMYFFYWVHTFRMQGFFLIAGFFAALLLAKRGPVRFVGNRLLRIGVPFILGLVLMYPLMQYQYSVGGLVSGRIQSSLSPWQLVVEHFRTLTLDQLQPLHLWFLETLLQLYAISLLVWFLFQFAVDRSGRIRSTMQSWVERVLLSPVAAVCLALPVGGLLLWDETFWGIETGTMFKVNWLGVAAYFVFYAVGWCCFRRPEILLEATRHWPWHVAIGTAMSLGLCYYFNEGWAAGRYNFVYPVLSGEEIQNYPALRGRLLAESSTKRDPLVQAIWSSLSPEYQRFVRDVEEPSPDQMAGLALELSIKTLLNPEFPSAAALAAGSVSEPWRRAVPSNQAALTPEQLTLAKRGLTEAVFGSGVIVPKVVPPPPIRALYFFGYGLTSWLLVLGTLGLFLRFCAGHSPLWRYLSDASYWLYLIHLPVLFQIQVWIAPLDYSWPVKYLLYLVPGLLVMVASYHFLVRPTVIGWVLNGRRYPLWREFPKMAPVPVAADYDRSVQALQPPLHKIQRNEIEPVAADTVAK